MKILVVCVETPNVDGTRSLPGVADDAENGGIPVRTVSESSTNIYRSNMRILAQLQSYLLSVGKYRCADRTRQIIGLV